MGSDLPKPINFGLWITVARTVEEFHLTSPFCQSVIIISIEKFLSKLF